MPNDTPIINIYGVIIDYDTLRNNQNTTYSNLKIYFSLHINRTIHFMKCNRKKEFESYHNKESSLLTPFTMVSFILSCAYESIAEVYATRSPHAIDIYDAILEYYETNSLEIMNGDVLCLNLIVEGKNNEHMIFNESISINIHATTIEEAYKNIEQFSS